MMAVKREKAMKGEGGGGGGRAEQEKSISSSSQLPNDALDCLSSCAETEGVRGD